MIMIISNHTTTNDNDNEITIMIVIMIIIHSPGQQKQQANNKTQDT